jgi:eukaryotic-like serine/threonine-protein kinase
MGQVEALYMPAPVVPLGDANSALPANVRVTGVLESGGQGVVYRGTVDGRAAAIKLYTTLPYELRVDREVDALRKVTCVSIAGLLWAGSVKIGADDIRVVATNLVEGKPLNQVLGERALTEDEIGAVIYDATLAVQSLWDKKIVHRDLKPSNLIFDTGRATVIDLGVARHVDQATLTATGSTWGTRGYMSPEQCRHIKQLTCRSDLFAIAVIALECAIQRHPTNGDQQRLVVGGLSSTLPAKAARLTFAPLLQRMLELRTTRRPLPEEVLTTLSAYAR